MNNRAPTRRDISEALVLRVSQLAQVERTGARSPQAWANHYRKSIALANVNHHVMPGGESGPAVRCVYENRRSPWSSFTNLTLRRV